MRSIFDPEMDMIKVQRAVIGLFFSGVKLSNGEGGICFTPVKEIPEAVSCPSFLRMRPGSGKLAGRPVCEYIDNPQKKSLLQIVLGISVLNALSAIYWHDNPPAGYRLYYGLDPVENKIIPDYANVVLICSLVPYIRMIKSRSRNIYILEKDARTLKTNEMEYCCPPEKSDKCIASTNMIIVTETTLKN